MGLTVLESRQVPIHAWRSHYSIPRRLRRLFVIFVVLCVLLGGSSLWVFQGPLLRENFDVVESGRVYRSAQPRANLAQWVERYRIESLLNLRGGSLADEFYREEVGVVRAKGIHLYDLPLSATERPARSELLKLIGILEGCRYPLLIHCKQGADRTGLASALYRLVCRGEAPETASRAFSLPHAHIPLFGAERLHEPIDEYAAWLSNQGISHTPGRFRAWLEREYRDDDGAPARRPAGLARGQSLPVTR